MTAPNATPESSVTPSSLSATPPGTPAPTSGSPTPSPEWRAGPNAPIWAQGKGPDEILAITTQLAGIVQNFNQTSRVPEIQRAPEPPAPTEIPDDEFVSGRQVKQYLQQVAQNMAPRFEQSTALGASANVAFLQQKYGPEFQKWGPELNGYIANLPLEQRTLDNLDRVVQFVRGNHWQDLRVEAEQQARQQILAEMNSPGLRSTGAPGAGPVPNTTNEFSLSNEQLPPEWRKRALETGLTDQAIADFCRSNEMTVQQFYQDLLLPGKVLTDKKG